MHNKVPYLLLVLMLMLTVGTFEFLHLRNSVPSVSAVEATGSIGIYWDAGCTKTVSSIDWGVLSPGQTKEVVVYARNEGNQSILLTVTPMNYSPANASKYLNFTWTCVNTGIAVSKTVQVTQSLYVSPNVGGISDFSFDIIFSGKGYILGDINGDGFVDIYDALVLGSAFGSTSRDSNWNPNADLNNDGVVDIFDSIILAHAMYPV
ncbi:MAG: dockerin type I domain-containing protein [Candidatus Bathyarchaeia archaeon]